MNRETEKIFYNQRIIIDSKVLTEPRTWKVTKVNRLSPNGLIMVTMAQDFFNEHTDYIEKYGENRVIGMWADYWKSGTDVDPVPSYEPITNEYAEITYSGAQNKQLRINSNYKTFTVTFYDERGDIDHKAGYWDFTVDGASVTDLISTKSDDLNENQIRIKFIGDDTFIGKDLVISYTSDTGVRGEITMNLIGI